MFDSLGMASPCGMQASHVVIAEDLSSRTVDPEEDAA